MCGFGDIARNYAPRLAQLSDPDLHFIFMVPDDRKGAFGSNVDYISRKHPRRDLRRLGLKIDLWHASHQQFRYRQRRAGTLQLLTIHDMNFLYEKKHWVSRWKHIIKMWLQIRHSDALTFISHFAEKEVTSHYQLGARPTAVIENGIALMDDITSEKPNFVKDENEKFFFTIGQIRRKKNFHTLVPMMKSFPDYHLYICGDKHFAYSKDVQACIDATAPDRIALPGKITPENKKWLFEHCQGFLFPSLLEGFGLPVLEAMSLGAKVFSSRCTSLPEVCGPHAYYFDDFIPEHMAEVVRRGLNDQRPEHVEAGKAYARSFDYDTYTQRYLALYRKLLIP